MTDAKLGNCQTADCLDLSVVIPVYRSVSSLAALVDRFLPVLESITPSHEIVFVDDGSPDHAWQVLSQLQAEHPERIVAVQLMRNFGQHNALMCGFRLARGRLVVTMDDDLQNPPEEVPKLVATMLEGNFDLVYGNPKGAKQQATCATWARGRSTHSTVWFFIRRFPFRRSGSSAVSCWRPFSPTT